MQLKAAVLFIFILLLTPVSSMAYIGPGLTTGTIGVVLGILGSILIAAFALLWYPFKRLWKKVKKNFKKDTVQ